MTLHMSRVAFGCAAWEEIAGRQRAFAGRHADGHVVLATRNGPTRRAEMADGSLFWIIKHRIVARQALRGFEPHERGTAILLDPAVVPVLAVPRRSHQGWRYLVAADSPPDLADAGDAAALPPELAAALAGLALL